MHKRATSLPAVYAAVHPVSDGFEIPVNPAPLSLEIFDVTYLHYHSMIEIGLCTSGSGVCYVEDQEYPFHTGDVQVIFSFQRHLSKSKGDLPCQWHWAYLDPYIVLSACGMANMKEIDRIINTEMGLCGILSKEKYPEPARLIQQIISEAISHKDHRLELCAACFYTLLIELSRASSGLPKLEFHRDNGMLYLAPALDTLNTCVRDGQRARIEDLARQCGMSEGNFRRVFKKVTGLSPMEYLLTCSLRKAEGLLLTTDKSVLEISGESGFHSISSFNRSFVQRNHVSPSEFRRKYR